MGIFKRFDKWSERISNEKFEINTGKAISCSECGRNNDKEHKYCIYCGHKLKKISKKDKAYKEYCPMCKEQINSDMDYCGKCGCKINRKVKERQCPICGKLVNHDRYCINCGHDFYVNPICDNSREEHYGDYLKKKCPNCNNIYKLNYNYCEYCGTKLIKK